MDEIYLENEYDEIVLLLLAMSLELLELAFALFALALELISFIKLISSSFIACVDGVGAAAAAADCIFIVVIEDAGELLPLLLMPMLSFMYLLCCKFNELNSSSYFCCGRVTKSFTFGIVRVEIKKE
jgi:hypothetical protein